MKLDHQLMPYTRKLKMIEDLNLRLEIIKLLEENMGSKLSDLSLTKIFSDNLFRQGKQKKKLMGLCQTKKLLHSKGTQHNEQTSY